MGTIRKHEVRIIMAISLVLLTVLTVAIVHGPPGPASSSDLRTQDAVPIDGVRMVVTGQAERTSTGYAVPVNVTNERDEAISIKDMRIVVTLADLTQVNGTCRGPDSVAPGATERFLIMIDGPGDVEIFVIDLLRGTNYLRAVMPAMRLVLPLPDVPQVILPDDDESPALPPGGTTDPRPPVKREPTVAVSLSDDLPLRPDYYEGDPPFFGEPATGLVVSRVSAEGNATDIAVYIHFPDMGADKVSVSASRANRTAVPVQLVSDGASGCYGLLVDDPSAAGRNWTWHYGGAGLVHYNVSIAVTTYELGVHELRLYAYDAGSGAAISEVEVTNYTVYGSGGAPGGPGIFETEMTTDLADPFVPGTVYNITFTDTCSYDEYHGTVRSVLKCPYATSVWLVSDGKETLITPNGLGEYIITWPSGSGPHDLNLWVQFGDEGGNHSLSTAQYWLEDASTGMILSSVNDEGMVGTTFLVRGPEPPSGDGAA